MAKVKAPTFKEGQEVVVRQIRSSIARPKDQLLTLQSMGLGRIGHTTTQKLNKSLVGKLKKVWHMVEVTAA